MSKREAWYRKIEEQLVHLQKRDAVGQLTEGLAHGFNNLLTVVVGHSELLSAHFGGNDKLSAGLRQIRNASERVTALTQQLFALSDRKEREVKRFDLNAVVDERREILQKFLGESIRLVTRLEPAWVKADRGEMEQLLVNLVLNARKAMPEGGTLTVTLSNVLESRRAQDQSTLGPAPRVVLEVTDTGQGMDEAILARLFEPFFTTKEGGAGLGLFIVNGIVRQAGGEIRVSSRPGTGSTFQIDLPRAEG
jgi:signal transduction histidine kinase